MATVGPRIHRLPIEVVNRIAAGEVIQRPSAAIKELLENSIDAGATKITIVLGQSGLKFLSITDNGCGINLEDFPIVCERFTTSKLREYKDLESIETFGFRGEALASISHVAHLSIVSKTAQAPTAFRASFLDGHIVAGDSPQPCAGLKGTHIIVEDLFYNIPMRLKALKNIADEYIRCLTTLTHFAVHFHKVGFSLKKQGRSKTDLGTTGKATRTDVIRSLFGKTVAMELLPISGSESNVQYSATIDGLATNANFNAKTFVLILFVNQRLVECGPIRRTIESVYRPFLPKGGHPFIYLDLRVPPHQVDVNVHPTKREVGLLHEAEICQLLEQWMQESLVASNKSKTYQVQTIANVKPGAEAAAEELAKRVITPNRAVRTDFRNPDGRLKAYLAHPEMMTLSNSNKSPKGTSSGRPDSRRQEPICQLTSISDLLDEIRVSSSDSLTSMIKSHVFVGCVDDQFTLIQDGTKLMLIDVFALSNHFFYEQCLRNFSNHARFRLRSDSALSIRQLCHIALDDPNSGWTPADGDRTEIAITVNDLFVDQRDMLDEYFSIGISREGQLLTLPQILPQYVPPLAMLPMFVLRCGSEVDWKTEAACFKSMARELALLYQIHPGLYLDSARDSQGVDHPTLQWTIEHILFPALRHGLSPPKYLNDNGAVVQVASTESLYRVFERC